MSIGIYALSYEEYNHIYIGQSVNIEVRVSKHISLLKHHTHYNYKLQDLYDRLGTPTVDIVELCSISELTIKENQWIEEFDSFNSGLNLRTIELTSNKGTSHSQAKFTEKQIINTFQLLLDPSNLCKDISECTKVSEGMVSMIACGQSHRWLEEKFPKDYAILMGLIGQRRVHVHSAKGRGISYPTILDPSGNEYSNITNVKKFAKEHNLNYTHLLKVLGKKYGAVCVSGWKLK